MKLWNLKKIQISNVFCFAEDQEVDFDKFGLDDVLISITGENNDEIGEDSNGVGKSGFFEVINWIVFGKFIKKLTVKDVVRDGQKEAFGYLKLVSDHQESLEITRSRLKTKETLIIKINGNDPDWVRKSDPQLELLKYLGFPDLKFAFNDYLNSTCFSTESRSFFDVETKPSERIGLVTRFLQLDRFNEYKDKARADMNSIKIFIERIDGSIQSYEKILSNINVDEIKKSLNTHELDLNSKKVELKNVRKLQEEIRALQVQIKEIYIEKVNKLARFQVTIEGLKSRYKKLKESLKRSERQLVKFREENKVLQGQIKRAKPQAEHYERLDEEIKSFQDTLNALYVSKNKTISVLRKDAAILLEKIINIKEQLKIGMKCPHCKKSVMISKGKLLSHNSDILENELKLLENTSFVLGEKLKNAEQPTVQEKGYQDELDKIDFLKKELRPIYKQYLENVGKLDNQNIQLVQEKCNQTRIELQQIDKEGKETAQEKSEYQITINKRIDEFQEKLNKHGSEQQIERVMNRDIELQSSITMLSSTIGSIKESLELHKKYSVELTKAKIERGKYTNRFNFAEFWVTGFEEIKNDIIEKFIPEFENETNDYLKKIEVGYRVNYNIRRQTQTGTSRYEFNIRLTENGRPDISFERFSTGQRNRIQVCGGLALHNLMTKQAGTFFNWIQIDEFVNNLDETGVDEFIRLLHGLPGKKFIVSHSSLIKSKISKGLKIVKENQKSTIHYD